MQGCVNNRRIDRIPNSGASDSQLTSHDVSASVLEMHFGRLVGKMNNMVVITWSLQHGRYNMVDGL